MTMRNASLEGVEDRIGIETGDMRALPFPDASFDVVVSSLAIHNIRSNVARARQWLKPGGCSNQAAVWRLPTFARRRATPELSAGSERSESRAAGSAGASGTETRSPPPVW